ncbi:MAG TPA: hypothetical protein PLZ51_03840 [Aggregatilineales bacterium]|nr:hypothetical protein [Aggregatilineales bacterium]
MRISVVWDDEDCTILRYTYAQNWTWGDYETAIQHAYTLKTEANIPIVDVIADFSESGVIPKNMISNFQKSLNRPQSIEFGVTVLVTNSLFLLRMIEVYRKINRQGAKKIRTAKTLDEARTMIAQTRITGL